MNNIKDKCAIVGIGETEYLVNSGRNRLTLALEAIKKAANDAGLSINEIDGIAKYGIDSSASLEIIAANLGLPNVSFAVEIPYGGGSSCATLVTGASAIASGMAKNVVCFRSFTPFDFTDGARYNSNTLFARQCGVGDFLRPFGYMSMIDVFAMCCRRHMDQYGTTAEQLGAIVVASRKHASMNPRALRRTPITIEDYLNSPMVVEPLREVDCYIEPNDGACAAIVSSAERAGDLKQKPAYIMAAAQASAPNPQPWWEMWPFRSVITESPAKYIAPHLFGMAGIAPKDIDVAEIYDCFSYTELVQIEDYGFCEKGEVGHFIEGGRIELGGELPINTHGGHLGEVYMQGFNHILEGVRQVRGTSSAQVENAELVLVAGAIPSPTSALILRR